MSDASDSIKHFEGSILKVTTEGEQVISSFLAKGEELVSDLIQRKHAEQSAAEATPEQRTVLQEPTDAAVEEPVPASPAESSPQVQSTPAPAPAPAAAPMTPATPAPAPAESEKSAE